MAEVPPVIRELVDTFQRNLGSYKSQGYNEANLRQAFINPFFEALGWDMANKAGHAEAYKDVIHEDAIKVGGVTKAPDYCFRIGSARKFFLEAKKPSVSIKEEVSPAYQLRRYAWSAKLPLSILTDFEEFAVYDCRARPNPSDKPATGRIHYLTYKDYLARWDEIASIFSREAVLKGSFDKYAVSERKRGTATVDAEFLAEIEKWREVLAKNLALRNTRLSVHDLNFAVQRTIDRLIFLRICEDRGAEHYGQLQALLNGENVYARLRQLYHQADDRYNSGLFHFSPEKGRTETPDDLTPRLKVDDKVLKDIISRLYYPQSPYEFSVFPVEILGQVYEQFLGKVIRLTAGHQAKVEEKPEIKKAGGVYYTPAYIVNYIVKQTVGKLCENKTPKQISKLRILDPACGSGSFLIGAYTSLLNYHRDWYEKDGPAKHRKELFQTVSGDWRLTTQEKKCILLNNIYGVDIDSQAVEVTKLSLLLKVLEGETDESLKRQLAFVKERALPDLGNNMKCGNSLIESDYFAGQLLPDEDEIRRINPFDWKMGFPEILKTGGFDVVIGNPPYVRQESLSDLKTYLAKHYEAFDGVADLYAYFMERSVKLLREGGRFSFIVSSSFLRTTYGEPLRRVLKKHAAELRILDFGGLPVFENAKDTYVCIPLLAKTKQPERVEISRILSLDIRDLNDYAAANHFTIPHQRLSSEAWALRSDEEAAVFEKVMKIGKPLGEYVERKFFRGLLTGLNEAFELTETQREANLRNNRASNALIKPLLGGQDIRRYLIKDEGRYLIVIPNGWTRAEMLKVKGTGQFTEREAWNWFSREHPKVARHLERFTEASRKRQDQGEYWWELRPCDYYQYFDHPKIIFPDICKEPRFYLDRNNFYLANTAYCLGVDDPYLLGILNSRLFWFTISNISIPFGIRAGKYRYRLIYQYMEKVPIRVIDFADKSDKSRHHRLVELVERMLDLHKRLIVTKNSDDKSRLQRLIDVADQEIDRLVYTLYGLTEEEIDIVEGTVVASNATSCENVSYEDTSSSQTGSTRVGHQAARVAEAARYSGEGGGGAPEGFTGSGDPIHGVREPTGEYGSPPDPPEEPTGGPGQLGSTRYFETAEGRLSYNEVSERLAVPLVGILDDILQTAPDQIIVAPEWLCFRHKRLAGHLYPEWAGRFRDVNVQIGSHTPPPYYQIPVFVRQFCDDLAERLRHLSESNSEKVVEFLAWADWRFQWIHPFKDFNGRIGRVLLAALLYKINLPHIETAPQNPDARRRYLEALHAADNGDLEPLKIVWLSRLTEVL